MADKKRLLVMTIDPSVTGFLRKTISNIIGKEVIVSGVSTGDDLTRLPSFDLILTSGNHLLRLAEKHFGKAGILAPRRIITGFNLEKVIMLPAGSRVLVVNNPEETTQETINSLKELGLTHLHYVPFWKGDSSQSDLTKIDAVITPAMSHLCPKGIGPVIDIGPRLISIGSFSEMLRRLNLKTDYLEQYATEYQSYLVESSRKLSDAFAYAELLRKRSDIIINEFDDGVLSVDEFGKINLANRSALKLLNQDAQSLVDRKIKTALKDYEKLADLIEEGKGGRSAGIYVHKGKRIVVSKIPVQKKEAKDHIYTLKEISEIQLLEKNVRVKLAAKGHLSKYNFEDIWGTGRKMKALIRKADQFSKTEKNILIMGESGTGKELVAHAIHQNSLRTGGPFVAVNFAGIPENLVESELFGYEEGAFTGARKGGKTGLFEQAHGGTIFLDEIGDASPAVQSRLLRVLQEREVMKIGSSKIIPVDLRIIAATNVDIRRSMEEGQFREDLYYRLSTLPLEMPSLREREGDILDIFETYLSKTYAIKKKLSNEVKTCLTSYHWPGNIRELINVAEYAFISSRESPVILNEHLPEALLQNAVEERFLSRPRQNLQTNPLLRSFTIPNMDRYLVYHILSILSERKDTVCGRNTLCSILRKHQIPVSEGRMKSILKKLKQFNLIEVGATKQGTRISQNGEELLNELHSSFR